MKSRRARVSSKRTCAGTAVLVVVFAFFFNVEVDLTEDGSGTMRLIYPALPIATTETETFRFASAYTEATDIQIANGMAHATVSFSDITRVHEAPELSNVKIQMDQPSDGVHRLRAQLRTMILGKFESDQTATVRFTFPGDVIKSNASQTSANTATWSVPVPEYFKPEGVNLDATYKAKKSPAPPVDDPASGSP